MSDRTAIEWTDATWNPVVGCTKVSAGCANCYAARMAATRLAHRPEYAGLAKMTPNGANWWTGGVRCRVDRLLEPFRWRKARRVFVCSMSDLFHEGVPDTFLDEVFFPMYVLTDHVWQVLTKRPARMREYLSHKSPLPGNAWLGVTAENQDMADERIPILLDTPAAVRFVSVEPMLERMDLSRYLLAGAHKWRHDLGWVIVGCETGPGARHMNPDWARSLRDQCRAAGVPFFVKRLSGRQPNPDGLMVREWPDTAVAP